ncbi:MAG: SIMPL domain-containing protein [Spirochaetales bacterium]|nr:SIMPL domain-containing protein [Spirochaetales bacterium]
MSEDRTGSAMILGFSLMAGLLGLGLIVSTATIRVKSFERSVVVKGLSEREYPADVVIWPIQFTRTGNDAAALYASVEEDTESIRSFLMEKGIREDEISLSPPAVTDKSAFSYGGQETPFRYSSIRTITVYSSRIDTVRALMSSLAELGRQGIVFSDTAYQTEYLFNRLNEIKPEMIEEATKNAREVAQRFADDSESSLGKIKKASQGQFSISPRDRNNPHIKRIRVVSTVEYYLR